MIVKQFMLNIIEVNSFVCYCPETKHCMIVDLGEFDSLIKKYILDLELNVKAIFVTHDHYDHTKAVPDAARYYEAPVVSGTEQVGGYHVDRYLDPGDEIDLGKLTGRVVDTCGHTPVALSLIFPGTVFSGDSLFAGSVGGTSNEDDYNLQIENVRNNLFCLPDDTVVHTGHGPSTTIGIERQYNPFFV